MKIIFATNNQHKVDEIKAVLPQSLQVITLKEAGIDVDIPEPHATLEENAVEKAEVIYKLTQTACFSEDTGLEVKALQGAPGVLSARYAGDERSDEKNIEKLLGNLKSCPDRAAQFKTVVCLLLDGQKHLFEGICTGNITNQKKGSHGFGYDPVFIPDGATKTFAQMNMEEKSRYSHRRKAVDKLVTFLNNLKANA